MKNPFTERRNYLGWGGVFMAMAITSSFFASSALASLGPCRTDPHIRLRDGTVLMVRATIDTSKKAVHGVTYDFDLPEGSTVKHINYTGHSIKEHVVITTDNAPDTYTMTTEVDTAHKDTEVTASVKAIFSGTGMHPRKKSARGTVASPPVITVSPHKKHGK